MTHKSLIARASLALALAWAVSVVGCSGATDSGNGFGFDNTGANGGATGSSSGSSADGSAPAAGHASSSSGGASPGSSSSGGNSAPSGSGSGSSSGSGTGSGSTSSGSVGRVDAGRSDASATADAGAPNDATMTPDTPATGGDGGLCDNAADWLTPMNQARAMVNAGEPPLVCDPIAAQVALNYANKCTFMHNANRNSDYSALGGTGGLGENLAEGYMLTAAQAVSLWVSEGQYYDHSTNTCSAPANQSCGHYTQVVWKATTAVGCALVTCTMNSPSGGGSWQLAVCDFSPPGNYVGQPPY
jgi:pathogenesis-related protein 1